MSRILTQITLDFGPEPELATPPVMQALGREELPGPQYFEDANVIVRITSFKPAYYLQTASPVIRPVLTVVQPGVPSVRQPALVANPVPAEIATEVAVESIPAVQLIPAVPVIPAASVVLANRLRPAEPHAPLEKVAHLETIPVPQPEIQTVSQTDIAPGSLRSPLEATDSNLPPEALQSKAVTKGLIKPFPQLMNGELFDPMEARVPESNFSLDEAIDAIEPPLVSFTVPEEPEIEVAKPAVEETPVQESRTPVKVEEAPIEAAPVEEAPVTGLFAPQPEVAAIEDRVFAAEPEIFAAEPEILATEPEVAAIETEVFAAEPEVFATEPETPATAIVESTPANIKINSFRKPSIIEIEEEQEPVPETAPIEEEAAHIVETGWEAPEVAEIIGDQRPEIEIELDETESGIEAKQTEPALEAVAEPALEAATAFGQETETEIEVESESEVEVALPESGLARFEAATEPGQEPEIEIAQPEAEVAGLEAGELEIEITTEPATETSVDLEAETTGDPELTDIDLDDPEELKRRTPAKPAGSRSTLPSKRGRKSLKQVAAEADLIEIPEDEVLFSKQYYTMGEVSEMFKVNQSLLRFWETEFDILQPRKNKKGDRYFRPLDIKNLHLIYHLLRQKKYTIEGAKEFLKKNKKAEERFEVIRRLQEIRDFLLEWKTQL